MEEHPWTSKNRDAQSGLLYLVYRFGIGRTADGTARLRRDPGGGESGVDTAAAAFPGQRHDAHNCRGMHVDLVRDSYAGNLARELL